MTRQQTVDQLAGSIRRLIEAVIAQDQRQIGVHQTVNEAETNLRTALRAAFRMKESAEP
jgi:hypothetical protein